MGKANDSRLWGATQIITIPPNVNPVDTFTMQLANVEYGRPDTWRFFLAVDVLEYNQTLTGSLQVDFIVSIGLGRANVQTKPFTRFFWSSAQLTQGVNLSQFRTTTKQTLTDTGGDPPESLYAPECELIPAQSIQCQVIASAPQGTSGNVVLACSAFFAPNMHLLHLPK